MNLTGKDLKAYREDHKYSQRQFARTYDIKRGTLAAYEWNGKELPKWIINKIRRFDPSFGLNNNQIKKENKSWLARFIGWLLGY